MIFFYNLCECHYRVTVQLICCCTSIPNTVGLEVEKPKFSSTIGTNKDITSKHSYKGKHAVHAVF